MSKNPLARTEPERKRIVAAESGPQDEIKPPEDGDEQVLEREPMESSSRQQVSPGPVGVAPKSSLSGGIGKQAVSPDSQKGRFICREFQGFSENKTFFPPAWPIRTRLGPYNCVSSEKQECTRTRVVQKLRQIITKTTTNKKQKTTTTKNDPQIPQPDLRFATKQNSEATKNGAGPNKTKNAFRFALDTVTLATVSSSKTCKLIIHCGSA